MAKAERGNPGFVETEELTLIKQTAKEVAAGYDDEYWREVTDGERRPTAFWQDCADAGFLGVTVPEELGGEGMGVVELTTIVEELGAARARICSSSSTSSLAR